jgi:hypothetical protein
MRRKYGAKADGKNPPTWHPQRELDPLLAEFIDRVVVPALVERLMRPTADDVQAPSSVRCISKTDVK